MANRKRLSRNPFHLLKKKSPRAWAIVTFPLFLIITLVLVPLVYVYEIIDHEWTDELRVIDRRTYFKDGYSCKGRKIELF